DEVFGYDNFKNEVVWQRFNYHADAKRYGIVHEGILFYTKTEKYIWNPQRTSFKESYIRSHFNQKDKDGRNYRYDNMLAKGDGPARKFGNKLISPNPGTHWRYSQEKIDELWKQDKLIISDSDRVSVKRYLDEIDGAVIHSIWTDINPLNSQAIERIDYPTQKPEALLERVIKASSNENDLVLDCFCGSGTTAAAADKLNRRWIACDLGRFAIHTTRKRLLGNPDVKPFVVQNLGKYERQEWMGAEFPDADSRAAVEQRYRHFMLQLFGAEPVNGYSWLHGVKAHRMVHIGGVDAPVSIGDVKSIVQEFWKSVGKTGDIETNGIDVLGWDFAFEINETARQFAAENKVDVKFKKIPREVLEKKAVDQGDIRFFELASLAVDTKIDKETVTVELTNFIVPPDDVPEDVRHAITHWQQWIDYWAVDWNYRNDTFHNEWQSYRTKKEPGIELSTRHKYKESGTYNIVIKIIDILGNDTTKLITVEIKL
ncbi:site-specific DNA-methyltransferase, partial [bacterium]|nr:site-specific DNA-methyltransferase [bacterium]